MTFDPRSLSTQATLAKGLPYVHMISMCYAVGGRCEFLKIFRLRPYIWPCDPKWPQMKKWSNNICRVGQGDAHTWVTGPCCIILRTWCVFGKNYIFDPCDLGWPLTRSRVIWHMRAGSLIIVTKFHWNRSKQLEGTSGYMVDRRKEEEP